MNYWLMKSEPLTYGIKHLAAKPKQTDHWDGIRNYQVRNLMRDDMRVGDKAFFYHSNCKPPGIVGIVEITREAYPDFTAWDKTSQYYDPKSSPDNPRWVMVDVTLKDIFSTCITLDTLKQHPALTDMPVVRKGNRLSITPVSKSAWNIVCGLADTPVKI